MRITETIFLKQRSGSAPSTQTGLEATLCTDDHAAIPLVVDVDGTLLKTDLLHESALRLGATQPSKIALLPLWLARGKAHLKHELASRISVDSHLPMREEVLALIHAAKAAGRQVVLASASDKRYVEAIAEQLGCVDGTLATDGTINLAGKAKAAALVERFGLRGFDYIGDSRVDFDVWSEARRVLVVSRGGRFESQLMKRFPHAEIVARNPVALQPLIKGLRVHQWAKNLLVFMPMFLAQAFDTASVLAAVLAFFAFSMAASSAYVLNDLLDLPNDRRHPTKSRRPFAAGHVRLDHAVLLSAGLLGTAALLASFLQPGFVALLAVYYGLTVAYSLVLKRKMLVDLVVLGGLYALRVLAGAAAVQAPESNWLLLFCFFLFFGLAVAKRITELHGRGPENAKLSGRGYRHEDLRVLLPLGAGAALGAPLVLGLYVASPDVLVRYNHPNLLWLIAPLLMYWTMRVMMLANRGQLHDDPVVFALTDRVSRLCFVAVVALVLLAR